MLLTESLFQTTTAAEPGPRSDSQGKYPKKAFRDRTALSKALRDGKEGKRRKGQEDG